MDGDMRRSSSNVRWGSFVVWTVLRTTFETDGLNMMALNSRYVQKLIYVHRNQFKTSFQLIHIISPSSCLEHDAAPNDHLIAIQVL